MQINISVLPPYSAYIQDYAGAGKQVQIFVRNTTATRLQVRLQGSVSGDNGVQIQTVPNYRPPVPLTLEPLQSRLLSYADLSGLFDLNQLDVQGVDRNSLYRGLPLPEGSYQLCIRAFDNATSRPLSLENPLGCSPPFPIKAVEPPILIAPLCDSDVQALTPQNLVFTWTPPIGVSPATVDYTLRIVELPLQTVDPNVFVDAVVLPKSGLEVKNLKTSTFLYTVVHPPLTPGKKYAWRVQARDLSGRTSFLNDGKSPVCAFQYGPSQSAGLDSVKTQPIVTKAGSLSYAVLVACDIPKSTNPSTLTAGYGHTMTIGWKPNPAVLTRLSKAMGFGTDQASVRGVIQKIPGAGYQLIVTDVVSGQTVWTPPVTQKEFISGDPDQPSFPLQYGMQYSYYVRMVLPADVQDKLKADVTGGVTLLASKFCSFWLKRVVPKQGFVVRGQVRYQFDGKGADYPANNTDVKISFPMLGAPFTAVVPPSVKAGGVSVGKATPQQKLAAIGGGAKATGMGKTGGTAASSVSPVGTADDGGSLGTITPAYYAKTDADGIYEVAIPWDDVPGLLQRGRAGGTGKVTKQVGNGENTETTVDLTALDYQLTLPSGYYQNTTEVRSFTYTPNSLSVAVGTAKVNVYAYSLKVLVSKDYNRYYNTGGHKAQEYTAGKETAGKVTIENSISQPVAGVKMTLYRKNKGSSLPAMEGQLGESGLEKPGNPFAAYIPIAQGKTVIETAGNGTQWAYVQFDRLLCNANTGDEYYLHADADAEKRIVAAKKVLDDKKKPTGDYTTTKGKDEDYDYAAPEDTVFFAVPPSTNKLALAKSYFSHQTTYLLRSLKPPTSRLSGRLLYKWPGDNKPDKFVMANMPFSVKVKYVYEENNHSVEKKNGKIYQNVTYVIGEVNYVDEKGNKHELVMDDRDFVAGMGKTDANGNFDLEVVNLNYKGDLRNTATVGGAMLVYDDPSKTHTLKPKYDGPGGQIQFLKDQGRPGERMKGVKDLVSSPAEKIDMQQLSAQNITHGVQGQINTDVKASLQNVLLKTSAPTTGGQQQKQIIGGGGPSDNDTWQENLLADEPALVALNADGVYQTVYRCFVIEPAATDYYGLADTITVQAFESKNLGEQVVEVKPYTRRILVTRNEETGKDKKEKPIFAPKPVQGARVVVFRESNKGMDHLPEKEGDGQNRFDKLPVSSFTQKYPDGRPLPGPDKVQYYGEGFTDAVGVLKFNKVPNLLLNGDYLAYVLPTEDATSYFSAKIQPLSKQFKVISDEGVEGGIDDSYDSIKVETGLTRLVVRLVDTTTSRGLKGAIDLWGYDDSKFQSQKKTFFGYNLDGSGGPSALVGSSGYREFNLAGMYASAGGWKGEKYFRVEARVPGYRPFDGKDGRYELGPIKSTGTSLLLNLKFRPGAVVKGVVKGPKMQNGVATSEITGIPSIIRRMADSAVVLSDDLGSFSVAVASENSQAMSQKIIIEPKDPGYWADTLTLTGLKMGDTTNIGVRMVARVKHRMRFVVRGEAADGTIIPDAFFKVRINDRKAVDAAPNKPAEDEFENVSVDNYSVRVVGVGNSMDWIPQQFEVKNKESKGWTVYTVRMKQGGRITGTVFLDGKPIGGAKVYLDYNMSTSDTKPESVSAGNTGNENTGKTLISTYSATGILATQTGQYTLRGLPLTGGTVTIRATLDGQGSTVIGAVASVTLTNGQASGPVNFSLTTYKGMLVQSLYGFPLTVEKLVPQPDGSVKITGQLDLKKSLTGFAWLPSGDVARVRDVVFNAAGGGEAKAATPAADNVSLEGVAALKFRYISTYNVLVRHPSYVPGTTPQALVLTRDNTGRGVLAGKVQVVDNSFDFPSTYLNFGQQGNENFFLANSAKKASAGSASQNGPTPDPKKAGWQTDSRITVLTALSNDVTFDKNAGTPKEQDGPRYYLTDPQGQAVQLTVLEVQTTADPSLSFIDKTDKKIHLGVDMYYKIPNAQPADFTVHIDDLVLDNKQLYPKKGSKPLELTFENWKLQVNDWTIDPKEGGITRYASTTGLIVSRDILMKTDAVDIPFGEFILRHDLFRLAKPRLGALDVGGVATLSAAAPDEAIFTYDVGFDGQGHWKLALFGKGNEPAGKLLINNAGGAKDLLVSKTKSAQNFSQIEFDYVQLLSNGRNILSIRPGQEFTVQGNESALFEPQGFSSGNGSMDLKGAFRIKEAPRAPAAEMAISYTRSNSTVKGTYTPLTNWELELKGHTKFKASPGQNLTITATDLTVSGTAQEEGASPLLQAQFRARPTGDYACWLWLPKQEGIPLGNGNAKYKVDVVAMVGAKVPRKLGDWDSPMTFIGQIYDGDKILRAAAGSKSAWYTQFTVYGDMHITDLDVADKSISVDGLTDSGGDAKLTTTGLKIQNIDTPLGKVALVFDFNEPSLKGSLEIKGVKMGPFEANGQGALLMDKSGFYLVASAQAQGDFPPPIQGIQIGIGVGYRDKLEPDAVAILRGTSKDPMLDCKIKANEGIHGFFLGGGVTVFHKEIDFDILVAEVWANADISLFASSELNIKGKNTGIKAGAGIVATGELGVRVFPCVGLSVRVLLLGDMVGTFTPLATTKVCFGTTVAASFTAEVDACGLLDGYKVSKTLAVRTQIKLPAQSGELPYSYDFVEAEGIDGRECKAESILCDCGQTPVQ